MVWPAIIAAAAGIAGGMLSNKAQAQQAEKERQSRFQFARHGISWRVQDAKDAGVHPLYAIGAQLPSFQPISSDAGSGYAEAGRGISEAVRGYSARQQAAADARMRQQAVDAAATKDYAQAAYYNSLAARTAQGSAEAPAPDNQWYGVEGQSAPYRPVGDIPVVQLKPGSEYEIPGAMDVLKVQPSSQMSARSDAPYVGAGLSPGSKEYRLTRDMAVLLPAANDLGEALEPLSESPVLFYMWYRINVKHYGERFTDLAFQELGFPNWMLRAAKGVSGWSDWSNLREPSVRYQGPGNPLLPRIPPMTHPFRR